jgi:hypothetical protein
LPAKCVERQLGAAFGVSKPEEGVKSLFGE